jgi:hypothetical protein
VLLNIYSTANSFDRVFEGQIEGIAHCANFLASMNLTTRTDQIEMASLNFLNVGLIALTIVAAERNVAFGGARLNNIGKDDS